MLGAGPAQCQPNRQGVPFSNKNGAAPWEETRGERTMKKLLIAAAAVLAVSAVGLPLTQAQAAAAKSPYCSMAGAAN